MPSEMDDELQTLELPLLGESMAAYAAAASSEEEEGGSSAADQVDVPLDDAEDLDDAEVYDDAEDLDDAEVHPDDDAPPSSDDEDENDAMEQPTGGRLLFQPEDEAADFAHLADAYVAPLFVRPSSDPSPKLRVAYAARASSLRRLDEARKRREEFEVGIAEKLGRLHNLMRESREREEEAQRALRQRTHQVYEMELQEAGERCEFNDMIGRLRAFARKYKGIPSLESLEADDGEEDEHKREARALAEWVRDQIRAYELGGDASPPPHHLAALEHAGVVLPLSDEDRWHRSLRDFQRYAGRYWDNPILVQATGGDVLRSIDEETDNEHSALRAWCREQQEQYQNGAFHEEKLAHRCARLVESGFSFDVVVSDEEWQERVEALSSFQEMFGHVHVPEGYRPHGAASSSSVEVPNLREFVEKVRALLHRDALSPRRLAHLKRAGLYSDMGGRVYDLHVMNCKEGREKRGEGQRKKRKFEALAVMARKEAAGLAPKKAPVARGNMDNWRSKLEKLVAYKEKHGTILDIQNDVKLRGWTYSIVRKLAINSSSLKGEKMRLIEGHEGLREYLLRKEHVEAATAESRARKLEEEEAKGGTSKGGGDHEEEELEELTEDVLLGEKDDEEVNAFMEIEGNPE